MHVCEVPAIPAIATSTSSGIAGIFGVVNTGLIRSIAFVCIKCRPALCWVQQKLHMTYYTYLVHLCFAGTAIIRLEGCNYDPRQRVVDILHALLTKVFFVSMKKSTTLNAAAGSKFFWLK